ncbi:uncharacterized protein [Nicotiana sylvestris]|uniref:uncharacterized protein n=1 Tax=Nicotiana sylvestris TaxID=4096 RepID=UPI00388C5F65
MGSSIFWLDNWIGLGALYFIVPPKFGIDENVHNVYDVLENWAWNVERLLEILLEELAHHIVQKEYLRRRDDQKAVYKMIWVKGLPFKIAFFMWKVWKAKLPLDDFMRTLGYFMPLRCWCYAEPKEESLVHLFFTSAASKIVWKYFLSKAGISIEGLSMHQAITRCWTAMVVPRLKPVMQSLPSCIV